MTTRQSQEVRRQMELKRQKLISPGESKVQDLAKEAAILDMLERFLMGRPQDIKAPLAVLLKAAAPYPLVAVAEACRAFSEAEVPRNNAFLLNAVEFVGEIKRHLPAVHDPEDFRDMRNLVAYRGELPPGMVPAGIVNVDFGAGKIDMTKLTFAEQERTLKTQKRPKLGYSVGDSAADHDAG